MTETLTLRERSARVAGAGLSQAAVDRWLGSLDEVRFSAAEEHLEADAALAAPVFAEGWTLLEALPLKSARSDRERTAGCTLIELLGGLCERFWRAHAAHVYGHLTDDYRRPLRVDALLWKAAERWPGVVPTRAEVEREQERMQGDKDGREIQQGIFLSHVMADRRSGLHLVQAMLRPKAESLELLPEFRRTGSIDLGQARVEVKDRTGYVFMRNTRFLNAEDESLIGPQETAIDLVLLHPDVQMGVLRGDPVTHPRYRGRRVFDAGINLTKLYHGKIGYLSFYIVRDFGLVNKLYRGLAVEHWADGEPENTIEKPWLAAVDAFAIGGGCQLLLVVDYVLAESGAYFSLPARKEGIIPGAANLRLPRFMGERLARQAIMFDRTFVVDAPEARTLVNEVVPRDEMDAAVARIVANAVGSGMVSAGGNRKAIRVQQEPLDVFRAYMATYCREQAHCHLSDQLIENLERHWNAKARSM